MDIAKAFDCVSHTTLRDTLTSMGLGPGPMIEYIMDTYKNSTTSLVCGDWESEKIHPTCGVKQGDPLSPTIFNMVMDRLLKLIPSEIGVDIDGSHFNALAFADDVIFLASTPNGLQTMT
ncbi:Retrovirus-related Pol polyprotein from type-2 retrotransposable element R2DM [Anthophora quadrimaculata]